MNGGISPIKVKIRNGEKYLGRGQRESSLCIIKLKTLCSGVNNETRNRYRNRFFFLLSKHGLLMVSVFHGLGVMHNTPCISLLLHFHVV